jgi:uncharacterized protein YneF (UPF0154 family)
MFRKILAAFTVGALVGWFITKKKNKKDNNIDPHDPYFDYKR